MKNSKLILILGGSRSGKSQFAEDLASQLGDKVLYLATAKAYDREMELRIKKHRDRRPKNWQTKEEGINIKEVILETSGCYDVLLLDCLTLWLSNIILDKYQPEEKEPVKEDIIIREIESLAKACFNSDTCVIIVSNEVGLGIVPDNPLGRIFRDLAGTANQMFAKYAEEVYFVAAGLPVCLKK